MELSRSYRDKLLRQEFGSWLLEDHIELAVIATDPIGTVVFWNRFASELYQYNREEAMGRNIMELTPSEMTQELGMEIFGKLLKGEHWKGFFGVQRKDKTQFMAHVTDTPVLDPEGQLKFVVGASADYTLMHDLMAELKLLNANLEIEVETRTKDLLDREQSLRMVGAAVHQSDTGFIIADEAFRIVWSNHAAQQLLQLSPEKIQQCQPWTLPLDFRPNMGWDENGNSSNESGGDTGREDDRAAISLSSKEDMVQKFFRSAGNQSTMHAFAECLDKGTSDEKGRLFLSISVQYMTDCKSRMLVLRDLTADREANQAHRRADREAAASRTKTEMIQMLSHEFRTPLQGIMGVVSTVLLDLQEDDSGLFDCLSTIAASSRLLLTLINNVLDLGKMDAKKMETIELSPTSVQSSIQDALIFCEPFARMNECKLTVKDQSQEQLLPDHMVVANKLRLEQVLINLLSNAVKYSGAGTEVQICIRHLSNQDAIAEVLEASASDLKFCSPEAVDKARSQQGSVVIVTIQDQGPGIPEKEMKRLFGEFNQLAISKEKDSNRNRSTKRKAHSIGQSSGSGLGLSLVLKFISMVSVHVEEYA
jgi:PAS domain S-box-containing protein